MPTIIRSSYVFFIFLLIASCKKNTEVNYGLQGRVTDADDGVALSGAEIKVEKQVVQNGVFGNTFQTAVITSSNAEGHFDGSWPRENFAALRMLTQKSNYITSTITLDVEGFGADNSVTQNVGLYKEAFTTFRFTHANGNASDRLSFTFLNADFNCNCCSNGWKTWQAASVDTTFTCRVYGNRWLKYQVLTQVGFADSSFVDSIYCPAFITTTHDIHY